MIEDIVSIIKNGKEWSWSVIGILTLLLGLGVRSIFLRDILREMKTRNRTWYHRMQLYYQRRAAIGWIFFGFFLIGAILLWRFDYFFLRHLSFAKWTCVLLALFIASLISHLKAYARAMVEAVQENVAADKDI